MAIDWERRFAELGILQREDLRAIRGELAEWVGPLAGRDGVAAVGIYGSAATGNATPHSDLDLVVLAAPGRWADLWDRRAELVEPLAAAPDLRLEHQWGEITDSVCYACVSSSATYLDLVIRRWGGEPRPGEVTLWSASEHDTAPEGASDPAPAIHVDSFDDTVSMFWMGALLCAQFIARGAVWSALDFVNGQRGMFLRLWRLVHAPERADYGWTSRVDSELPLEVRQRLAAAVPGLARRELAAALWEVVALAAEHGPRLARALGRPYPDAGAAFIQGTMSRILSGQGLAGEAPSRLVPDVDRGATVSLREITADTVRHFCLLDTAPDQRHVVAPNARSIAQAHFAGERAWFRGIYAAETPVGFVMLYDDPVAPEYFLWRLMIDARYQGLGYGRRAVELLIEYVRSRPGAKELLVSYHKGPGSPEGFYRRLGFVETGAVSDDEHIACLDLAAYAGDLGLDTPGDQRGDDYLA